MDPTLRTSKNFGASESSHSLTFINNVSRRPSRKSQLGTRRVARDSILLFPSESMFSIREELKANDDSIAPKTSIEIGNEKPISVATPVMESNPDDVNADLTITNQNNFLNCPIQAFSDTISVSLSQEKVVNPFQSPNDDSFIAHETMMLNDGSLNGSTMICPDETLKVSDNGSGLHDDKQTAVTENVSSPAEKEKVSSILFKSTDVDVQFNSVIQNENSGINDNESFVKLLDSFIERNVKAVVDFTKQIAGLQMKIDECNRENAELSRLKGVLMYSNTSSDDNKENFQPPKSSESFNTANAPFESAHIIQEMKRTIKCLKTPKRPQGPRKSMMLTPHSMSYHINKEWKNLIQ